MIGAWIVEELRASA